MAHVDMKKLEDTAERLRRLVNVPDDGRGAGLGLHSLAKTAPRVTAQRMPTLPKPAAETYTAQSNEVYPTPCATVPSIIVATASD